MLGKQSVMHDGTSDSRLVVGRKSSCTVRIRVMILQPALMCELPPIPEHQNCKRLARFVGIAKTHHGPCTTDTTSEEDHKSTSELLTSPSSQQVCVSMCPLTSLLYKKNKNLAASPHSQYWGCCLNNYDCIFLSSVLLLLPALLQNN